MSPLAQNEWTRLVAATPGMIGPPLGVAVALTKYINWHTSDARPSVSTLAAELGLAERTIQKAARALEAAGLLTVEHPAGRKCCTYTPANPVHADRVNPVQADGVHNLQPCPARSPTLSSQVANPVQTFTRTGLEQVLNREEASELDTLARLQRSGAHMTRGGSSIAGEWSDLAAAHGVDAVLAALAKLPPKDKWPSRVRARIELAEDLPGLAERPLTADQIRALMGHGAGGPADG